MVGGFAFGGHASAYSCLNVAPAPAYQRSFAGLATTSNRNRSAVQ
jgi:hypothetical protein